ncbi:MAG: hypothetical protein ACI8R4_002988 [Paracoccaceae bacterium]|jgi:hypothetical protein
MGPWAREQTSTCGARIFTVIRGKALYHLNMTFCPKPHPALRAALMVAMLGLPAGPALAHASEQGFVLLLPTDAYILAGAASVALTVLLLAVLPGRVLEPVFRPRAVWRRRARAGARQVTSTLAFLLLVWLIWVGLNGDRDPLENPMSLFVWTIWWIGFVTLQGLLGDFWRWVNPWTGPVALTRKALGIRPFLRLPARFGHWLALLTFLGFVAVLLADPAPADPARLAGYVGGYWLFAYLGLLAFGPRWLLRAEGFSMLMRNYTRMALFGRLKAHIGLGVPGWQVLARRTPPIGVAVFMLVMLGSGSFDGLNETFWWFGLIGINPLEFPGRSAVITENLVGLVIANTALIAVFATAVWLGLKLVGSQTRLIRAFCLFAPTILPIALGYHIAHYFTSFLVDGQYTLVALSDPLANGADYLRLGHHFVSTGFFNNQASVRAIWLTQAGAVVAGHILAVMLAHTIALHHFGSNKRAALSQAPLALFMVFYTLFGLWLLASPRVA